MKKVAPALALALATSTASVAEEGFSPEVAAQTYAANVIRTACQLSGNSVEGVSPTSIFAFVSKGPAERAGDPARLVIACVSEEGVDWPYVGESAKEGTSAKEGLPFELADWAIDTLTRECPNGRALVDQMGSFCAGPKPKM